MLQPAPRSMQFPQHKQPVLRAGLVFTLNARAAALLDANAGARDLWAIDQANPNSNSADEDRNATHP